MKVVINKTARTPGEIVEGEIVEPGDKFSLVQLKNYRETFWNDEIRRVKSNQRRSG